MTSLYARVGLTRNPFVADPPNRTDIVDRGIELPSNPVVQVVGARGAGKTSLLRAWHRKHAGDYHYVNAAVPTVPGANGARAFWDEADRLPMRVIRRRARLAMGGGGQLVVSTHQQLSLSGGLVLILDTIDPEHLRIWMEQRIAASACNLDSARAFLGELPVAETLAVANGSWRVAGDELHAWVARRVRAAALGEVATP